jgi:hypothetical protein
MHRAGLAYRALSVVSQGCSHPHQTGCWPQVLAAHDRVRDGELVCRLADVFRWLPRVTSLSLSHPPTHARTYHTVVYVSHRSNEKCWLGFYVIKTLLTRNSSYLYFGVPRFESRAGTSTVLMEVFHGLRESLRMGPDRLLTHGFQFTVHHYPSIRRSMVSVTDSVVK